MGEVDRSVNNYVALDERLEKDVLGSKVVRQMLWFWCSLVCLTVLRCPGERVEGGEEDHCLLAC